MKLEIEKNLVVSTGHISKDDNDRLETDSSSNLTPDLVIYKYQYGFFIFISDELEESIDRLRSNYTEALCNLLTLAKANGCRYLKLDRDGQTFPELPVFDW